MCEMTSSHLILFNKRRRAEVLDLTKDDFLEKPNWHKEHAGEMDMAMSPTDRMLAER